MGTDEILQEEKKRTTTFFLIAIASLLFMILLTGCDPKRIDGPSGDATAIPFDLVVPVSLTGADYYAISGTQGSQQVSQVNDSLIETTLWKLYAQFLPVNGAPVDFDVYINTAKLARHHDGDTLRLRSTFDTTVTNGEQTWHLRDSGETRTDLTRFILPSVTPLDTIGPFQGLSETKGTIRSDTSLIIRWQPGGGGTVRIEWVSQNNQKITKDAQDFSGSYALSAQEMSTVKGPGTVRVTRYRTMTTDYNGKSIIGIRLTQRTYEVNVQ